MKPSPLQISGFFQNPQQYLIPPYQRGYEWKRTLWHQLFIDLIELTKVVQEQPDSDEMQFLGFIITKVQNEYDRAHREPKRYQLIDGQQRFLTLLILELAICDAYQDVSRASLQDSLTFSFPLNQGDPHSKLVVNIEDRALWDSFIENRDSWRENYKNFQNQDQAKQNKFERVYRYFRSQIYRGSSLLGENESVETEEGGEDISPSKEAPEVWRYTAKQKTGNLTAEQIWQEAWNSSQPFDGEFLGEMQNVMLDRFKVLELQIEESDGSTADLFKAVNEFREPLEQWDFIRNDLFVKLGEGQEAKALYRDIWAPMSKEIAGASYDGIRGSRHDVFLYDYLVARRELKLGGYFNRTRSAGAYQKRVKRRVPDNSVNEMRTFLEVDLLSFERSWIDVISMYQGKNSTILQSLNASEVQQIEFNIEQIGKYSAGPLLPLVAALVELGVKSSESGDDNAIVSLGECIKAVEWFIVRYVLGGGELSPLRAHVNQSLNGDTELKLNSAVVLNLLKCERGSDWHTSDKRLRTELTTAPVYSRLGAKSVAATFRSLEKRHVGVNANSIQFGTNNFTIEHVFPKKPSARWKATYKEWVGSEREADRQFEQLDPANADGDRIADRLGNLAIVTGEINQYMSNTMLLAKRLKVIRGDEAITKDDAEHRNPPLWINQDSLPMVDEWTIESILNRNAALVEKIIQAWPQSGPCF